MNYLWIYLAGIPIALVFWLALFEWRGRSNVKWALDGPEATQNITGSLAAAVFWPLIFGFSACYWAGRMIGRIGASKP